MAIKTNITRWMLVLGCILSLLSFSFNLSRADDASGKTSTEEQPMKSMDPNSPKTNEKTGENSKEPRAEEQSSQRESVSDGYVVEPASSDPVQPVYPGVKNLQLKRGGNGEPSIDLFYPGFGRDKVDAAIRKFIESEASAYENDIKESIGEEEKPESYDMWDMGATFTISYPNPDIASVTFNIYTYTGGAHGNLEIRCLNYVLNNGASIEFNDLFKNREEALAIMSRISSTRLTAELGEDADESMIASGTAPELDNFANLELIPDGIVIQFQPYQVGPWAVGPQQVKITLDELSPAMPNPQIWLSLSKINDNGAPPVPPSTTPADKQ